MERPAPASQTPLLGRQPSTVARNSLIAGWLPSVRSAVSMRGGTDLADVWWFLNSGYQADGRCQSTLLKSIKTFSPANEMAGSEFRGHLMNRAIATAALSVSLVATLAACTPSATAVPSVAPIVVPSVAPSVAPSAPASSAAPSVVAPSVAPSTAPSVAPSVAPSPAPSAS